MFSAFFALLVQAVYVALRLGGGGFPKPLSAEEERETLLAMEKGDLAARNKLVEHNLRLVAHIVKKYYSSSKDQDDLISIGTIGLIKAINSFKIEKNIRLATFAARCIENEIFMYFRSLRRQSCEVSISEPIDTDKDGNTLELMDILSFDEDMLEAIDLKDRTARLTLLIDQVLENREREIILKRYGLGGNRALTQREVASELGISRSYVSRIEKKALEKLEKQFLSGGFCR